jgi:uncharacterized membrane-anchored protein
VRYGRCSRPRGSRPRADTSIQSISTHRCEAFYWTAILLPFAPGNATADLRAQVLGWGFLVAGVVMACRCPKPRPVLLTW